MARPVYNDERPTARARLKAAFWQLLAKEDYQKITVKMLAAAAQVNPNTFYYHYASMDALAREALDDEKLHEIPEAIHANICAGDPAAIGDALKYLVIGERWRRIRLFIGGNSLLLRQYFYDALEQFWLSLIGIPQEAMSENDYRDFTFILHGAMSVISMQSERYDLEYVNSLSQRPLGQGIIKTLEHLIVTYRR